MLGKQLLRSGTSIGANVFEAHASQSKADFIAKLSVAHKESRETVYWLRVVDASRLVEPDQMESFANEANQLVRILAAMLLTAKGKRH